MPMCPAADLCAALEACLPAVASCPAPVPDVQVNIQPTLIERSGGAITISLDPPLPIERVHIGAAPCLPEQSAPYTCRAPAWSGAVAAVDVIIDVNDSSGPRRIVARDAIRYALPDFVQWPGDPLGPAVGVLRDGDRLILTRADAPPDVVAIGPRLSIQSTLSIPPYAGVVRWPDGLEVYFEASAPGVLEVPRPDQ